MFDLDALVRWLKSERDDLRRRHAITPELHLDIRASEISNILLAIEQGQFEMEELFADRPHSKPRT